MNFINDVDLETPLGGGEVDFIAQFTDVVDAGVGGCVDLDQVHETPFVDGEAVRAVIAGALFDRLLKAVDSLCEQARAGGLAGALGTGKEVSMPDAVCRDRVFEGLNDVVLTDDLVPEGWSPGAVECLSHGLFPLRYREVGVFVPLAVEQGQVVAACPEGSIRVPMEFCYSICARTGIDIDRAFGVERQVGKAVISPTVGDDPPTGKFHWALARVAQENVLHLDIARSEHALNVKQVFNDLRCWGGRRWSLSDMHGGNNW